MTTSTATKTSATAKTKTTKAAATKNPATPETATRKRAKVTPATASGIPRDQQMDIDSINKEIARKAEADEKARAASLAAAAPGQLLANAQETVKAICANLSRTNTMALDIAIKVHWLYLHKAYEHYVGKHGSMTYCGRKFSTIDEMTEKLFGFKKSATYNFINIAHRFGELDLEAGDGTMTGIMEAYKDYTISQLAEMVKLTDEQISQLGITPETSVRDIRKKAKSLEPETSSSSGNPGDSDDDSSSDTPGDSGIETQPTELQQIISFKDLKEFEDTDTDRIIIMMRKALSAGHEVRVHYVV